MKRWLVLLPFAALLVLAGGLLLELFENDDAIRHFDVAGEGGDLPLELGNPFGEATLEGTLLGARGETLEDAVVFLNEDDTPFWDRTDASGHFAIERLPAGAWRVVVVARGYLPQTFELDGEPSTVSLKLEHPIEDFPEIPVLETGTLEGRLLDPAQADARFAGYEVYLRPRAPLEERRTPFPRRTYALDDGSFRFDELAEGRYEVCVLPPWASGTTWPDLSAEDDRDLEFDPQSGLAPRIGVVRGELRGRLTDTKGAFLEGALVILEDAVDPRRVWEPVSTGADGSFLIVDLPPATYRVRARAGAAAVEQTVDVRAGVTLSLDLDPLATRSE